MAGALHLPVTPGRAAGGIAGAARGTALPTGVGRCWAGRGGLIVGALARTQIRAAHAALTTPRICRGFLDKPLKQLLKQARG